MKLVSGIVGLLIFAVSLPSASQTVQDAARVSFYDKVYPQPACKNIPITATIKLQVIRDVETRYLKYVANPQQYDYSSASNAEDGLRQIKSKTDELCTKESTLQIGKTVAEQEVARRVQAEADKLTEANRRAAAARATTTGRAGAAGAPGSDTGLARDILGTYKEARDVNGNGKGSTDRSGNGDKASSGAKATSGEKGTATPAAGSAPVAAGGKAVGGAATAAAVAPKNELGDMFLNTKPVFSNLPSSDKIKPIPIGNNGSEINLKDHTFSTPLGEDGTLTKFTLDRQSGHFVAADGSMTIPAQDIGKYAPGCTSGECAEAMKTYAADPKTAADVKEITSGAPGVGDAASQSAAAQTQAAATTLQTNMTSMTSYLGATICADAVPRINAAVTKYTSAMTSCGNWQSRADTFCSVVRSPKAKVVQRFMTLGTAIIARTSSASEGCSAAQKFSTIAQQGMTAANLACTGLKYTCDFTCAGAETSVTALGTTLKTEAGKCSGITASTLAAATAAKTAACAGPQAAALCAPATIKETKAANDQETSHTVFTELSTLYTKEPPLPKAKVALCEKYEADILDMGLQILGTIDATNQAKACKKALGNADGGGGGTNTPDISMEEFCKTPGQAALPPCKCRTEPTAQGCPGFVANNINTNINKNQPNGGGANTNNLGGVAALATPGGLSGFQTGTKNSGSTLSKEAKELLGVDSTAAAAEGASANGGGFAGTADSSGSSGNGQSGSSKLGASPDAAKKLAADKKKSGFGEFEMSGAAFGNLKWGADGKAIINGKKYSQEEIKILAARKIASEEFFQQVTTASGKSNWDKVRVRYDENRGSLFSP